MWGQVAGVVHGGGEEGSRDGVVGQDSVPCGWGKNASIGEVGRGEGERCGGVRCGERVCVGRDVEAVVEVED